MTLDMQKRANEVIIPLYPQKKVALASGDGVRVKDTEGKSYIDFAAGIAVCSLGHNHPVMHKAITEQLDTGLIMTVGSYPTEPKLKAAELLINNCCQEQIFFCNSGAEAVEGSLKLARAWAHKNKSEDCKEFITFKGSFHGRTYGAVSATYKSLKQPKFGPYLQGMHFADYGDLDSVKALITDKICGIIFEPVQGEGGLMPGDAQFFQGLRKLCDEHQIVMISDEIQAGMGRMGTLMAHEAFEYEPDVVCLAKGMGSGFPVGAFMAKKKFTEAFEAGDHGTTYGGNPLATNVVYHVVSEMLSDGFLDHVNKASAHFLSKLETLKSESNTGTITDVRGKGLMIGIDTKFKCASLLNKLLENGLLATQAGANTLRLTPPLTVNESEIDEAVDIIAQTLRDETLELVE
ncbi:MAG: acetylornithine/succinylornithine family transaminase [Pseudomonadota bacterium]